MLLKAVQPVVTGSAGPTLALGQPRASSVLLDFSCDFGIFDSQSVSVGRLIPRPCLHICPGVPFTEEAKGISSAPTSRPPQICRPVPLAPAVCPPPLPGPGPQWPSSLPARSQEGRPGEAPRAWALTGRCRGPQGALLFQKEQGPWETRACQAHAVGSGGWIRGSGRDVPSRAFLLRGRDPHKGGEVLGCRQGR